MMVGLDFFFGNRKPRTEVEVPVAFVCLFFLADESMQKEVLLSLGNLGR